jgi:hypothetical protein
MSHLCRPLIEFVAVITMVLHVSVMCWNDRSASIAAERRAVDRRCRARARSSE